ALSDAGLRETLFMSLRDILPVDHSMDVDRDIPLLAGQSHDGRVSLTPGGVAKTIRPVADHAGDHDRSQVWDRRADELMQLLDFTSPRFVQQLEILLRALGLGARRQIWLSFARHASTTDVERQTCSSNRAPERCSWSAHPSVYTADRKSVV